MEILELTNAIARVKDLALIIVVALPAVGVGLFLLKGAFGHWRLF